MGDNQDMKLKQYILSRNDLFTCQQSYMFNLDE